MSNNFIQELFTSRKNYNDGNVAVGQTGRLWYESNTNSIRVSDGSTPGGRIVSSGIFYDAQNNVLKYFDTATNQETTISISGGNANKLVNGAYELVLNNDGSVSFPAFTLPSTDGNANQVLTTDGNGNVTWQDQVLGNQIQADWQQADNTKVDFIKNKPTKVIDIPDVYTGGAGNPNLQDGALLAYDQINTRWNVTSELANQRLDAGEF